MTDNFADGILKLIFWYENCCIFIEISGKFVAKDIKNNKLILVQVMAWHRAGFKLLPKPVMA